MQSLFSILFLLLFTPALLAQKNCRENIYQVADAGWISQSIPLNATPNQAYSIRLINSIKGLTATITAKNNLSSVSKGDYWIFVSIGGEKRAFPFLDKTRPVTIEGREFYVNMIALNWENLAWLAKNKVAAFGALDAEFKRTLIREVNMTKTGTKAFLNSSKCLYTSIDKDVVSPSGLPAVDNQALSQANLEKEAMNTTHVQFNNIELQAEHNPERYQGINQPEYAKSLSRLAELHQAPKRRRNIIWKHSKISFNFQA